MELNLKRIKVAIGIIFKNNKVLICKRLEGKFMSEFWEFAGGKIENKETALQALKREMLEELGIEVQQTTYLRNLVQKYPEKIVSLSVFIINKYSGLLQAKEGQKIVWTNINDVPKYNILPTVMPLLNFAILPKIYWITPSNHLKKEWMDKFKQQVKNGIKLIQFRAKEDITLNFIKNIYQLCQLNSVKLLLNIPNNNINFDKFCDGYHLTSLQLQKTTKKYSTFMSASTHTLAEAKKAEKLDFNFIMISPVLWTQSHPNIEPIGFENAKKITTLVNIPVYFLGGMSKENLPQALENNACGIAGISSI